MNRNVSQLAGLGVRGRERREAGRSLLGFLLPGALAAAAVIGGAASRASAASIVYTEQDGKLIFVNANDPELVAVEKRSGVAAGRSLIERRRDSLADLGSYIDDLSRRNGLDPALVNAVIEVESAWNPRARSRKNALGLMQLLPETAARLGVSDPFDPRDNIAGGIRYLRFLLDRFAGDLRLALAGYNAGEKAVEARGDVPPYPETRSYVKQVLARYGRGVVAASPQSAQIYETVEDGRLVYVNR
ncbi:MAG TPA: lytic transglycosylase domain-containing protein [Terriglobia bacterium]|nr:lytic transglycosylase domain-containing protein [Terriglobia bacterium]